MTTDKSPMGLPPYMTGRTVVVDGERYVSLRHVHALFEHTTAGMAFYRVRRRWVTWRRGSGVMFGEVTREDRPQDLLNREFGHYDNRAYEPLLNGPV